MNESSSNGDVLLQPNSSEIFAVHFARAWPNVVIIIILFNFPRWHPAAEAVYFIGGIALIYCVYRLITLSINNKPEKVFMRITSHGFRYRSLENSYELSWSNVGEFLVEKDVVWRSWSGHYRRVDVKRFYVITKDDKEKLYLDHPFRYDPLDLAIATARKMCKSLDLPSEQGLLTVVDMKSGKEFNRFVHSHLPPYPHAFE